MDRTGHTEREWEKIWSAANQNDGAQTAHFSEFDEEIEDEWTKLYQAALDMGADELEATEYADARV